MKNINVQFATQNAGRDFSSLLFKIVILMIVFHLTANAQVFAQEKPLKPNYLGIIPAFLMEPYDTIDALEVNLFPLLYEARIGKRNDFSFQFRPILNYRFLENRSGFSQIGGTVVANRYFLNMFAEDFWLKPTLGVYYTYAYNRLDKIQTMTLGIEPGAFMQISDTFSMSVFLQPGINYFPDEASREYVETESGFKSHFGVFFHVGYNF